MGAYCPLPWLEPDFAEDVIKRFVQPTLDELRSHGIDYRGVLYTGLMLTDEGPNPGVQRAVRRSRRAGGAPAAHV